MPTKRQVRKKLADMGVEAKYLAGQDGALSPVAGALKGTAWTDNPNKTNLRPSTQVNAEDVASREATSKGGDPKSNDNPTDNSETYIMGLLASTRSPHPPEKVIEVLTRYVTLGSYEKATEGTGISPNTVKGWKRQDWWPEVYAFVARSVDTRLEGYMTGIMESAVEHIKERMEHGDYLVHQGKLTGERKPLDVGDLVKIFGVMFDKRQLSRGLSAISGGESVSQMDKLEAIAKRLESAMEKRFGVTLEGEYSKDGK